MRLGHDPDEPLDELPFTTKAHLRDAYPFGLLQTPLAETVRVHASSGTRGKPTIVAYTRHDIDVFADVCARSIAAAGGRPEDVLHIVYVQCSPTRVDPETGEPTAGLGELVLATLTKEPLPVLRYRTGDVTRFVDARCGCGRTHRRIARFTGRFDDMLIVRGVNVF